MSLNTQEEVLLDLLFSRDRREHWLRDPDGMLAAYDLTDTERADFAAIRPDGLQLDARVRLDLMLSQLCRSFPLSFSLLSSLPEWPARLEALMDADWIRGAPAERMTAFGLRLRDDLEHGSPDGPGTEALLRILDAELALTWTAGMLKGALKEGYVPPPAAPRMTPDWEDAPLRLAAFTALARLPRPYAELKDRLCPCTGAGLWRHLRQEPLDPAVRQQVLADDNPRLLVVQAALIRPSACDPEIDHRTAELPYGFAELLDHLDGFTSTRGLLDGLAAAGATAPLLAGVRSGILQLLQAGMLEAAPD